MFENNFKLSFSLQSQIIFGKSFKLYRDDDKETSSLPAALQFRHGMLFSRVIHYTFKDYYCSR